MPDTTIIANGLPTGWTVYTVIRAAAGPAWNGTAYVTYDVADWADYAVATPETPAASGTYIAQFPLASPAGFYTWTMYRRTGVAPSFDDDPNVTEPAPLTYWDGTTFGNDPAPAGGEAQSVAASDEILSQPLGTDRSYDLTIRDADGAPIVSYDGTELLSCALWSGQDQAVLATPTAAWLNPAAGTIRITVSDVAIADLAAGLYRLQGTLTDGATAIRFFDGSINLTPSPGVAAAPATYCTFADVLLHAPQVQRLQDVRAELAGFLGERGRARTGVDECCLDGYRPNYGRARRGVAADGTTPGPHLRWVPTGPGGAATPTIDDLRAALARGGLTVTAKIREASAHLAAAIVFLNQPGKDNPYHQQGEFHQARGVELLAGAVVEVDLDDPLDGVADVRIGQDCTWLS